MRGTSAQPMHGKVKTQLLTRQERIVHGVLSWLLRSGGWSSQCAPVARCDAWWNDKRNDRVP
jgi:hypothetical protein